MGFPFVCYCVVLPRPLILLIQFLEAIKLFISAVLFYLGFHPSADDRLSHLTVISPTSIKASLSVVEFARGSAAIGGEDREAMCAVCLGELEARDEVRELANCFHLFHKGCIDKWVDVGQLTCPLCRSQLLPRGQLLVC